MKKTVNLLVTLVILLVFVSCSSEDTYLDNKVIHMQHLFSSKINEYGLKNVSIHMDYLYDNINSISEESIEQQLATISDIRGRYLLYKDENGVVRSRKITATRSSGDDGIFEIYSGSFSNGFFVRDKSSVDYVTIYINYIWNAIDKSSVEASISSDCGAECSIINFDYVFSGVAPSFTCSGEIRIKYPLATYEFNFMGDFNALSNIGSITIY